MLADRSTEMLRAADGVAVAVPSIIHIGLQLVANDARGITRREAGAERGGREPKVSVADDALPDRLPMRLAASGRETKRGVEGAAAFVGLDVGEDRSGERPHIRVSIREPADGEPPERVNRLAQR